MSWFLAFRDRSRQYQDHGVQVSRARVPPSRLGEPVVSTDHRKPVMAFVVLALMAACLVGVQRAEAQSGRLLAAAVGLSVRAQGSLPDPLGSLADAAQEQVTTLGPLFELVLDGSSGPATDAVASDSVASDAPTSASDATGRAPHAAPSARDRNDDARAAEPTSRPVAHRRATAAHRGRAGATAEHSGRSGGRAWHGGRAGARSREWTGGPEDKAVRRLERARQKTERRAVKAAHALERSGDTVRGGPSKSSTRQARAGSRGRGTGPRHQSGRSGRSARPGGAGHVGRPGGAGRRGR